MNDSSAVRLLVLGNKLEINCSRSKAILKKNETSHIFLKIDTQDFPIKF